MQTLFDITAFKTSRLITQHYSTSFSLGIRMLDKKYHMPVYAIYGFVRYADEIVDTFHNYNKKELLERFKADTWLSVQEGISLNPVLHSFQMIVNTYHIEKELIDAFLYSMEMDLYEQDYDQSSYEKYIYGSAEVVGLMCLRVFCGGDAAAYEQLKPSARRLGSAFQKVNFLRDIQSDYLERSRIYFPGIHFDSFDQAAKEGIEKDIRADFDAALEGIRKLPKGSRMGVYLAYMYYKALFRKIEKLPASRIMHERVRIPDGRKLLLLLRSWVQHRCNYLSYH